MERLTLGKDDCDASQLRVQHAHSDMDVDAHAYLVMIVHLERSRGEQLLSAPYLKL